MKEVFNSMGRELPTLRARRATNPAFLNPGDLAALGVASGDLVEIESGHGLILGVAEADASIPTGVVSMAHSWGDLPSRKVDVREMGSTVALLVDNASDYDPISGIARQSAIPVNVRRCDAP